MALVQWNQHPIIVMSGKKCEKEFFGANSKSPMAKVGLKDGNNCRIVNITALHIFQIFCH